jgi:hypothetical protein
VRRLITAIIAAHDAPPWHRDNCGTEAASDAPSAVVGYPGEQDRSHTGDRREVFVGIEDRGSSTSRRRRDPDVIRGDGSSGSARIDDDVRAAHADLLVHVQDRHDRVGEELAEHGLVLFPSSTESKAGP